MTIPADPYIIARNSERRRNCMVRFEGNSDAAAEMFIEAMTRRHSEQWNVTCSLLSIAHRMPQIKDATDCR